MKVNKLIIGLLLFISLSLISGCDHKTEMHSEPEVEDSILKDTTDQKQEKNIQLEEKEENEINETSEENGKIEEKKGVNLSDSVNTSESNSNQLMNNWINTINELQKVLDVAKGINDNMSQEERHQRLQSIIDDINNGLNDETIIYYEILSILSDERMLHLYLVNSNNRYITPSMVIPLTVTWLDNKLYIWGIDSKYSKYLGYEIVTMNGFNNEELTDKLSEIVSYETDAGKKGAIENTYLSVPYLKFCNVMQEEDDSVELQLRSPELQEITITLKEEDVKGKLSLRFITEEKPLEELPMFYNTQIKNSYFNYSYEPDPENKTMYFQYNRCEENQIQWMESLFKEMIGVMKADNETYERLVIDLRVNGGGNRNILWENIFKYREYLNTKKIAVITGYGTASAGVHAIEDCLNLFDNCKIYGSPTAGAVDNYTEVKTYEFKEVGVKLYYPTYHDDIPCLEAKYGKVKESIIPDVVVEQTYEDFCKGIDTVYERILQD